MQSIEPLLKYAEELERVMLPDHLNHSEAKIFEAVENWQNISNKAIK